MDELANRLREDAEQIRADVSPALERRIHASLEAIKPEKPVEPPKPRTPLFWLVSSLTGLAAAVAVIAIVNRAPTDTAEPMIVQTPPVVMKDLPTLPLNVRNAMTTSPLERELTNLQSDLEKARRAVQEDVEKIYDPDDTP